MEEAVIIKFYHSLHLSQKEMLTFLAHNHGIIMSRRTLQRKLNTFKLYRRKEKTNPIYVAEFIRNELQSSEKGHGYKWMHMKSLDQGLMVDQETVRQLID